MQPGAQRPVLRPHSTDGTAPGTYGTTWPRWWRPSTTECRSTGYWHWSLVDNYEWGSYEPRFGLYGIDRHRGEHGYRWLDTDAMGDDSAGTYRGIIAGLRAGDRSVLASSG